MKKERELMLAMFDIRPVDETGRLNVKKIKSIKAEINLRMGWARSSGVEIPRAENKAYGDAQAKAELVSFYSSDRSIDTEQSAKRISARKNRKKGKAVQNGAIQKKGIAGRGAVSVRAQLEKFGSPIGRKDLLLREFEESLSGIDDARVQLASAGGIFYKYANQKPRALNVGHSIVKQRKSSIAQAQDGESGVQAKLAGITSEVALKHRLYNQGTDGAEVRNQESDRQEPPVQEQAEKQEAKRDQGGNGEKRGPIQESPAQRELEVALSKLKQNGRNASHTRADMRAPGRARETERILDLKNSLFKKAAIILAGVVFVAASFTLVNKGERVVRSSIEENGQSALFNLQYAQENFLKLNFEGAAKNFSLAYDDFNSASGFLDKMGASFISVFGDLPVLSRIDGANNLVEAGKSISQAGKNLALAFATISERNLLADINPDDATSSKPLSDTLKEFKEVLVFADKHIKRADRLLADVDTDILPEDRQELFLDFKARIPEFQNYIGGAINYTDFLMQVVGNRGAKKYIVLLQNNAERRATGGFPGTYGLMTFNNGRLQKVFLGDIYEIDGQIKKNIIPPEPLAHITPNWGMRDANWFADFPSSAKKIEEFYKLDGGMDVDGVISITPYVIERILEIVGPIDMPDYNLTVNKDNFIPVIQNQVEYEGERSSPKQILFDLQPLLFAKLAQQDKDLWVDIFKILLESIEQKHLLAYFNDEKLQKTAELNGFSGRIENADDDYIQVNFSNIKGSKTDGVTDNALDLQTKLNGNYVEHTLTIHRVHNGGDSQYGFYNKTNRAYVRVYVPDGSELLEIKGESDDKYAPLVKYDELGFKEDPDLAAIEETMSHPFDGVDVFKELGKTVFGFWLDTKPQSQSTAVLSYKVPRAGLNEKEYSLLWQKQSGSIGDLINFNMNLGDNKRVLDVSPNVQLIGDTLIFQSDLSIDREVKITLN